MLTDTAIKAAKPGAKPFKLADSGSLYLLVRPNASRWWRFDYRRPTGGRNTLSLGTYPDTSLKLARQARDEARRALAAGIDPGVQRQAAKSARVDTFETIAREWLALQQKKMATATHEKAVWTFEKLLFPYLGSRQIKTISPYDLLTVLRKIEVKGHHETAHRTKSRAGQVFRYAIATERAERDITADLRDALAPVVVTNRAAITEPARIGELLRAIDGYSGQLTTAIALKLAPLLFVRPGELRGAEWDEIDLDRAEWRIGAHRMKMREEHLVPLPAQAVALFRELAPITGQGRFVFPSLLSKTQPMSDNTVNAALRRLGFAREEMTGHGFRALASTRLNEMGIAPDVIELQLAHAERNKVRAAYNRAQRLPERRKLMQDWADYLDGLRTQQPAQSKASVPAAAAAHG